MARFDHAGSAEFNMNMEWLIKLSSEIDKFRFARHIGDIETMYISLDNLELLSSPKIDDDAIEQKLKWIEINKDKWCVRDESGTVMRVNEENKNLILKELKNCFRLLLDRLDSSGILTKLKQDPGKAMGNFKGS